MVQATFGRSKPQHFHSRLAIVRNITVYQPAVPIRAVCVAIDDEGEMYTHDETVLGIQITVADRYEGSRVPADKTPTPHNLSHEGIARAGYYPDVGASDYTAHDIIVWSSEFGHPVALTYEERSGGNFEIIAGPATNSQPWWDAAIRDAASIVRKRLERRAGIGGAA